MGVVTKRVNIDARFPVRSISPVIHGVKKDTIMTSSDILKCLCRRARVEEILPNGTTVLLNMNNYYTDNGAGLDATHTVAKKNNSIISPAEVDEQPPVHIEPLVEDNIVDDINIEDSTVEETVVEEDHIDEESHEEVVEEVPEAPIEAQVVETKTDDEVECEVESKNVIEETTEAETQPVVASVNATNTPKKNNNSKKKK